MVVVVDNMLTCKTENTCPKHFPAHHIEDCVHSKYHEMKRLRSSADRDSSTICHAPSLKRLPINNVICGNLPKVNPDGKNLYQCHKPPTTYQATRAVEHQLPDW